MSEATGTPLEPKDDRPERQKVEARRLADYLDTINRLEPDLAMIDMAYGWASVAISLKRIADSLERLEADMACEPPRGL